MRINLHLRQISNWTLLVDAPNIEHVERTATIDSGEEIETLDFVTLYQWARQEFSITGIGTMELIATWLTNYQYVRAVNETEISLLIDYPTQLIHDPKLVYVDISDTEKLYHSLYAIIKEYEKEAKNPFNIEVTEEEQSSTLDDDAIIELPNGEAITFKFLKMDYIRLREQGHSGLIDQLKNAMQEAVDSALIRNSIQNHSSQDTLDIVTKLESRPDLTIAVESSIEANVEVKKDPPSLFEGLCNIELTNQEFVEMLALWNTGKLTITALNQDIVSQKVVNFSHINLPYQYEAKDFLVSLLANSNETSKEFFFTLSDSGKAWTTSIVLD